MLGPPSLTSRAAPLRMRPRVVVAPDPRLPRTVPDGTEAVVVGGGIAGVSAAVVLAERGVAVTLLEAAPTLGGRLGAWPHTLPDGTDQVVEHGFHAFFRHYYTWRDVLRRIDPELGFLRPVGGYPVLSRTWAPEDLTGLPAAPPLNLLALFARSPSLGLRDLFGSDTGLASELLAYDRDRTTALFDDMPAADVPARAGHVGPGAGDALRGVRPLVLRAAGSPVGRRADRDVPLLLPRQPGGHRLRRPRHRLPDLHLGALRRVPGQARRGRAHRDPGPGDRAALAAPTRGRSGDRAGHRWRVGTDDGALTTQHLVLATEPGALRDLFAASPDAALAAPRLAAKAAQVAVAPPFAVTRLWLDRDVAPERPTFSAISREPTLDSVTVYSRLERPSEQWAARTGGSVVELHSYACTAPDVDTATDRMRAELAALWPETADARVVHLQQRMEATAPTFPPGGAGSRPAPSGEARGIRVAGDHVETPFLTGLMERASASGVLAANDVLAEVGVGPEPIRGVPQRGLLAGLLRARSRP